MSLARRAVELLDRRQALPDSVAAAAKLHLLDAIGVGLAASTTTVGAPYTAYAATLPEGTASVLGHSRRVSPRDAALVNGGLIHGLEYDDTHTGSIVHGSAVLASAALAGAQRTDSTGQAFLAAYAGWYEVLIRLGLSAAGGFQRRGYQLTSVGGALAAAGTAATLKRLSHDRIVNAVGISLSQASGVFEFLSNGATVKSLHPGWAAQAGLTAADLAEVGLTGPETAIEGSYGLFRVFAAEAEAAAQFEAELASLGETWHLLDAAYKFHPCCHYIHAFLEAVARMRENFAKNTAEISEIVLRVPKGAAPLICEPWEEKLTASGHLARWSLPVTVAMQLVEGRVDLDSFESPVSGDVQAAARLCRWEIMEDSAFPERFDAEVTCVLADGRHRTVRIDDVFGNATRPPTEAAVRAKFHDNAKRVFPRDRVEALEKAVDAIDHADDLSALTEALSAPTKKV